MPCSRSNAGPDPVIRYARRCPWIVWNVVPTPSLMRRTYESLVPDRSRARERCVNCSRLVERESGHTPIVAPPRRSLDDLVDELRARGQRVTVARRAVLETLLEAGDDHLTADELAPRVRENHPAIHLSTVYRTLDTLAEAGVIVLARFRDRPATYHLAADRHHHAVCTRCGTAINLPIGVLDPVRRRLLREHGFHADAHHLTIPGLCRDCAALGTDTPGTH